MGWGFRVTCPDCGREWADVQTSYRIGPWSETENSATAGSRSWFCPRCYFRLYLPRAIEQDVWRNWYEAFLVSPDAEFPFLRKVTAKLDEALSDGGNNVPLRVELEPVDCPGCQQPFEESHDGVSDRLVCPHCEARGAVLDEFESHCQMALDQHGFS
jgi:hypothetical protein